MEDYKVRAIPKMYCLFDKKTKQYDGIQLAESEREIISRFKYYVNNNNTSQLVQFPEDFAIYEIVYKNNEFEFIFIEDIANLKK